MMLPSRTKCPFCGTNGVPTSEQEELQGEIDVYCWWYVECAACGSRGPAYPTAQQAAEMWDRACEAVDVFRLGQTETEERAKLANKFAALKTKNCALVKRIHELEKNCLFYPDEITRRACGGNDAS